MNYQEKLKTIKLPPRMYPPEHPGNLIRAFSLIDQLAELLKSEDDEDLEEGEVEEQDS